MEGMNRSGQAIAEYIILLAIVVLVYSALLKSLGGAVRSKPSASLSSSNTSIPTAMDIRMRGVKMMAVRS